ncbi:hemagglutinin [Mycoplasmopsis synoviae]|uniref:hemagglutinin n=1 Tax=Mycoplasmopsis synoviae TaxID=2109 RepID=UPI0035663682
MPKIVVEDYVSDGDGNNRAQHEAANQQKLQEWFNTSSNWEKLSEQLTKKLGADKFKNVTLTNPQVSYEEVTVNSNAWKNPKVTFNIQAKPGYQLTEPTTEESQISLSIRVLYSSQESNQNLLTIQGTSPTAAPNNTTMVSDPNVLRTVNVYLNYTGPNIELDAELPQVGNQNNTSINGTSNVEGTFNDKFKKLLVNVVGESITQTSLLQAIINYVNKFDPKFPASFVLKTNGVAIASVQNNTQLRIGSLNDFLYNNKGFLQQVNTDTKAVYFAVMGVTSNGWVNTFLIRIPLTKFVRPISVLEEQTTEEETQESQEGQENQEQGSTTQTNTESSGTGQSSDLTEVSA